MIVIDVDFILGWRSLPPLLPAPGAGKRNWEAPMAAQAGWRGSQTTRLKILDKPDGAPVGPIAVVGGIHKAAAVETQAEGVTGIIRRSST